MPHRVTALPAGTALLLLALATLHGAIAATPGADAHCESIADADARLRCYDTAHGAAPSAPTRRDGQFPWYTEREQGSVFDQRWELAREDKRGTFEFRPYKPVYFLPIFLHSRPNDTPDSENPLNQVTEDQNLNRNETKVQISFKTKLWEKILADNGDLWFGYTQSSRWQLYNGDTSRPFRETDHEPELMLIWRTDWELLGFKGRLVGLSLNHQSNGRSLPFSRSWNRVILPIGIEYDRWSLFIKPWWRISEDAEDDDNPLIEDYVGRGELQMIRTYGDNIFSGSIRHSLRDGDRSHGSLALDWSIPIKRNLRAHLQLFHGYGESLIDYNHRATVLGVGISLVDWY
ncbi:MAG: phospholipase A [Thiotrichales bacterium]